MSSRRSRECDIGVKYSNRRWCRSLTGEHCKAETRGSRCLNPIEPVRNKVLNRCYIGKGFKGFKVSKFASPTRNPLFVKKRQREGLNLP
jgi:hypothetical protein